MIVEIAIGLMGIGIGAVWCWLICASDDLPTDVVDTGYIGSRSALRRPTRKDTARCGKTKGKTT